MPTDEDSIDYGFGLCSFTRFGVGVGVLAVWIYRLKSCDLSLKNWDFSLKHGDLLLISGLGLRV